MQKIIMATMLLAVFTISLMSLPDSVMADTGVPGDLFFEINNPTPEEGDRFGRSIAVTPDGNFLIGAHQDDVGATNAGSVYLIDGTDGTILLTINNPIPDYNESFGYSVAVTPDGNFLIGVLGDSANVSNAGFVYLIDGTDGTILLTINNPTPEEDDWFGSSVAITPDGNFLVSASHDNTGATISGSVYLYDGTDGALLLTINNPTPAFGDRFGNSVAVTPDGNLLVGTQKEDTGAKNAGSVYLFDGTDGTLLLEINNPTPEENDQFGHSVASTPDGNLLIGADRDSTGATMAGSVYLFDGNDGSLLLTINNPTPEESDQFGIDVATTPNGNLLVSANNDNTYATNAGSVYLFDGTDGTLLLTINNLTPEENDQFGNSVAVTPEGNLLVSANYDNTYATNAGSVYLFNGLESVQESVQEYDVNITVGKGDKARSLVGTLTNTNGDWNGSYTVNGKSFTIQSAMFLPNADDPSSLAIQATNDGIGLDRFLSLSILTTEDGFVIDSNANMPSEMWVINVDHSNGGEPKKIFPINSGIITIRE